MESSSVGLSNSQSLIAIEILLEAA